MGQINLRGGANSGFYAKNLQNVAVKLQMYSAALKNPAPALMQIEELFIAMEEERFRNYGAAPEFGISEQWQSISDKTVQSRKGSGDDHPLVNFGYLRDAAVSPIIINTPKSASISIDPRKKDAPEDYSHKQDYGYFHQTGDTRDGVVREIITITIVFREEAMRIMQSYIGIGKEKVAKVAQANSSRIEGMRTSAAEQAARQRTNQAFRHQRSASRQMANSQDRSMAELAKMKDPKLSTYSHYKNIQRSYHVSAELKKAPEIKNEVQQSFAINKASQGKLTQEQYRFYGNIAREHKATGAQKAADGFNRP